MEADRYIELANLASAIAEENIIEEKTDLHGILLKKEIELVKGNYEHYFEGNLVHFAERFYLHLNKDLLHESHIPKIRFMMAHELGHFFIDEHRDNLANGTSLSFNSGQNNTLIEKEANHFASFLLMPETRFLNIASTMVTGLPSILHLSTVFESPIHCTAIHYIKTNCCTGMLIRWNEDNSVKSVYYSKDFCELLNTVNLPVLTTYDRYLTGLRKELFNRQGTHQIIERATLLSRWIASIQPGSKFDMVALEQSVKLGSFGGLTFITINQ